LEGDTGQGGDRAAFQTMSVRGPLGQKNKKEGAVKSGRAPGEGASVTSPRSRPGSRTGLRKGKRYKQIERQTTTEEEKDRILLPGYENR